MTTVKISALTALTTPATGDELVINDISEALDVNKTKKITLANLIASLIPKSLLTAVGDIIYASGSATPAVLAKPAATSVLQNTSGGALSWKALTDFTTSVIYRRQGGSASVWATNGSTTYTPTAAKIQAGSYGVTGNVGETTVNIDITFPIAYSQAPIVLAFPSDIALMPLRDQCTAVSSTGFTYTAVYTSTASKVTAIFWMAIGE